MPVAGAPSTREPEGARAYTVGLTGGIASGKSTVARRLAEAGFTVIDADRLVAELYRPGGAGAAAVQALFGDGVLNVDGAVDHAAVAKVVFDNPEARRALEAAIHPLVRRPFSEIAEQVAREQGASGVAVLEATLLVEAGYPPDFDMVVTVEADEVTRLRRAVERGLTEEAARARLAAQGSGDPRRAAAHRILTNDGTLEELHVQVDALAEEIRQAAARR
jgi:dephospho-CoA kinase